MMLLVAGLLALLCVIAVVYPFLRRDGPEIGAEGEAAVHDAELESVLDSIRTLRLERQLNRVTEAAYEEHLREYRLEAASLLRQTYRALESGAERNLERSVLLARLADNGIAGDGPVCEACGTPMPLESESCPTCGGQPSHAGTDSSEATQG
jgi:recombinational DNA repair protein (RecF pathway)